MACRSVGAGIIVCGPRGRAKKCAYCSRPSSKLCDFPVPDKNPTHGLVSKTCDKPLCDQCTRHTEPDIDVCRVHPVPR
jgi:hypothetical protein